MIQTLIALAIIFSQLSVLAFGGGNTIPVSYTHLTLPTKA